MHDVADRFGALGVVETELSGRHFGHTARLRARDSAGEEFPRLGVSISVVGVDRELLTALTAACQALDGRPEKVVAIILAPDHGDGVLTQCAEIAADRQLVETVLEVLGERPKVAPEAISFGEVLGYLAEVVGEGVQRAGVILAPSVGVCGVGFETAHSRREPFLNAVEVREVRRPVAARERVERLGEAVRVESRLAGEPGLSGRDHRRKRPRVGIFS